MSFTALKNNKKTLQKFIKILEMTKSKNDAEALVATRKSQAILRKYNINYQNIFENLQTGYDPDHIRKIHKLKCQIQLREKRSPH